METLIYPDAKAAVVAHLRPLVIVPVVSRVPRDRPSGFVRVLNAGGSGRVDPVLEEVALTVESWDNDESTAERRAQIIRDHLRRAYTMGGHPVYGYSELGAPVDLPDESGQCRYTFTFSIRMRPISE